MTDIIVVGCGGTGSHYIKELGRLLYGMKAGDRVRLILVDGDSVEEKNLVRQAFLAQDIGRNKAQVMSEILSQAMVSAQNIMMPILTYRPIWKNSWVRMTWCY